MLEFQGQLTTYRGEPCVRLFGSCREHALDRLGGLLLAAEKQAREILYVDLAPTRLLDSASLGTIVFHHNRLRSMGRKLVLLRPSPTCRHLLEITSLLRLLDVRDEGSEIEDLAESPPSSPQA